MEVGRYTAAYEGSDLYGCICVLMWVYCVFEGGRENGGCVDMKMMTSALLPSPLSRQCFHRHTHPFVFTSCLL